MKTILLSLIFALLVSRTQSAEPTYTLTQIDELIEAGTANWHGANFANQGLECMSYLWKDSDQHHVFFFRRAGKTSGEFRDEVLDEGRFIAIFEKYLVADLRKPEAIQNAKELVYVCKETKPVRKQNVMVELSMRWFFLTTDLEGKILKRQEPTEKRMIRGVVSFIVPDELSPDGGNYFLDLKRSSLTPYEKAFGDVYPVVEKFGLSNRRTSIWAEWPADDPELVAVLSKQVPNPPGDAMPSLVRKETVASMKINLEQPQNVPFIFTPNSP